MQLQKDLQKQRKKAEHKEAKLRQQSLAICLVAVSFRVGDSLVLIPWGTVAEMPSTKPPQHVKLRLLHICVRYMAADEHKR